MPCKKSSYETCFLFNAQWLIIKCNKCGYEYLSNCFIPCPDCESKDLAPLGKDIKRKSRPYKSIGEDNDEQP